jgi:hypothetical protein
MLKPLQEALTNLNGAQDQDKEVHTMSTEQSKMETSQEQSAEIKCLAECPKCRDEGVKGLCGLESDHTSAHRCDRCSHTWE